MQESSKRFIVTAFAALLVAAVLHSGLGFGMTALWEAVVHLMLFGWITGMIYGINQHTLPVFSGRSFAWPWMITLHWLTFTLGITLSTIGFVSHVNWLLAIGLWVEFLASLVFMVNVLGLFLRGASRPSRPPTPPWQKPIDPLATRATKFAGMSLPLALGLFAASRTHLIGTSWLLASEHLMTLGWLMLMIVGVAGHILPRMSGQAVRSLRTFQIQQTTHFLGVGLIVPALGFGWRVGFMLGAILMTVALLALAWLMLPPLRQFKNTSNQRITQIAVGIAFASLVTGIGLGVAFAFNRAWGATLRPLHAELNLWGWSTFLIYGMGYQMLPRFMQRPAPSIRLLSLQIVTSGIGILLTVIGWWLAGWNGNPWLTGVGSILQGLAAGLFCWMMIKLLWGDRKYVIKVTA